MKNFDFEDELLNSLADEIRDELDKEIIGVIMEEYEREAFERFFKDIDYTELS